MVNYRPVKMGRSCLMGASRVGFSSSQLVSDSNVLQKEKLDNMSLIPDCEGKKHPVESSHFTGTKCNWTWNSEIYTLDIRIVDASVSLKGHGREKPIPMFDGKSPIIQKGSKLPNAGQLPVSKVRKTKSSSHLVNISLLSADVHNANGKIDLSQYTQHPVLFAPAIWTAGKEEIRV